MPGKHRLYMHCPGLSEDQLYMYFQQYGRVTDVYLPKALDGQSKGYGFASFENAEALTAALDAGEEHSIRGKTVRVNRAGPRPAVHLVSSILDPSRQPLPAPISNGPLLGGVSRQRGGQSTSEPSSSGNLHQSLGVVAGSDSNPNTGKAVSEGGSVLRSTVPQGAGPRIYVGGIPNAVSETMVRKYFSNWGKVEDVYFPKERVSGRRRPFCFVTFASQKAAEKAVAQSTREISGYQVASISMTADRVAHYQQVSGGGEEIRRMFQDIEPAHPFALRLQGLFPHLTVAPVQHASLTALGADDVVLGHQPATLAVDDALGPLMGLGGHPNYNSDDATLHPSAFATLSQQQLAQPQLGQPQLGQPQLGLPQLGQQQLSPQLLSQPQLGQQQLGQPQLAQQQLSQSQLGQEQRGQTVLGRPQLGQQQLGQPPPFQGAAHVVRPPTPPVPGTRRSLQYTRAGVLQPQTQQALLSSDIQNAADLSNAGIFSSNFPNPSGYPYGRINHHNLLHQQAVNYQLGHQATVGQHPLGHQPGHTYDAMLSYNSCPLDVNSAFRAQVNATPHGLGLAQTVVQGVTPGQTHGQSTQSSQDFNPTVGPRQGDTFGLIRNDTNFGEAPPVPQDPLVEPYMVLQIPEAPQAALHGPIRGFVLPHNTRRGPY